MLTRSMLVLAVGATLSVGVVGYATSTRPRLAKAGVLAFERSFFDLAEDMAIILEPQLGGASTVKGSLADIEQARVTDEEGRRRCAHWERVLERVRATLASAEVSGDLRVVRDTFLAAAVHYEAMIDSLEQATTAPVAERTGLVDRAVAAAKRGDSLYDRAVQKLAAVHTEVGLPPDARLPDPDQPLPPGVEVVTP